MDRFPPAEDGPRYELATIARSLDDLAPEEPPPRYPELISRPLLWTFAAVFVLVAFVGWLLVG
jgi:hypothetical protein